MRRRLTIPVGLAAVVGLAGAVLVSPTNAMTTTAGSGNTQPSLNQDDRIPVTGLIVKYRAGVKPTESPGVATGTRSVDDIDLEPGRKMSLGLRTVELSEPLPPAEAAAVAEELEQDPRVETATPDLRVFPAQRVQPAGITNPDDPFFRTGDMWGLNGAFGIDAQAAWSVTRGSPSLVVAVLDSGIQTHPDLASSSQVAGYDFITEVPSANDGDGRDADPSDPGDWVSVGESGNSDGPFYKCEIHDSSWHGTHVTGTINAASDNGIGVSSVAPQVKVQPVRVLGKCGGALSDIFDAIAWSSGGTVPNVSANPTPAAVINLSLGGSGACSDMLQSVLDAAVVRGSTIVVSAGNEGSDAGYSAPASCANVVTVGASNSLGKRAAFSNHGSKVDLSAPGSGIWSTSNSGSTAPSSPTYQRWDGTSMAAPHVAGLAALVKATNPGMTPTQIEARLRTTTSEFAGGGCSDWVLCGTGIANAAAVTGRTAHADPLSAHPPGRVRTIKTVYKGRKAVVKWTKPTDTGRASILGYHFQIKKSGTGWSSWKATTSKKKTIRRTKQAKYVIKVAPINSAGRGQVAQTRIKRK